MVRTRAWIDPQDGREGMPVTVSKLGDSKAEDKISVLPRSSIFRGQLT